MTKGTCGYCLGEGIELRPLNNDIKEAEKNNFVQSKCPVCGGSGNDESDDTFTDDELITDADICDDEIPEPLIDEEEEYEDS